MNYLKTGNNRVGMYKVPQTTQTHLGRRRTETDVKPYIRTVLRIGIHSASLGDPARFSSLARAHSLDTDVCDTVGLLPYE